MISKLIGTTAGYIGYDNKNNIFEKIRTNPNSGIIVDNFDLGSLEFQNIFLKILEDNFIEDASGKKIDFSNSIIIFTSDISDDSNKLGFEFNKANDLNEVSKQLQDRVSLILNTEKMDRKNKERMIFESINKIITKYRNIKINYNDNLINYFVESLDKKKNMNINKIIEEEFESKIIDAIINNKNEIYIDSKRISNTFS
jgi:ATP-dependent Clp protease ATP-binding subunit ClpA